MAIRKAQAHEPRQALCLPTRTSPRSPSQSPRRLSSKGLKKSGRTQCTTGRKTSRHRGGGAKARLPAGRLQASQRTAVDAKGWRAIEYDPNRSAYIALLPLLRRRRKRYILAPSAV